MQWIYGKNNWRTPEQGEENCYLLTNGLGGFSSLTITGSNARNDQALLMASLKAPTVRYHLVTNVHGKVTVGGKIYDLASQRYVNRTKNQSGQRWLQSFSFEYLPVWQYHVEDVDIVQTVFMRQGENTVGIRYEIEAGREGELILTPWMQFVSKGQCLKKSQSFEMDSEKISSNGIVLYYRTNGLTERWDDIYSEDWFYDQDARDGRDAVGCALSNHRIHCPFKTGHQIYYLVYSMKDPGSIDEAWVEAAIQKEIRHQQRLMDRAGFRDPVARMLSKSANQYLTWRETTESQSVIAGFPFFGDWGRDTMIALAGCTLAAHQFESAKSILRTFMAYCKKGLMPNMFPEDDAKPLYNTVDASLLFIEMIYLYLKTSGDMQFVREAWPEMTEIVRWYQNGTDYGIHMDEDGLISAGEGLYQLTWMDVRVGDILPTPRHGKPVEINAYWYNALMILAELAPQMGEPGCGEMYRNMAERARVSFLQLFWDEERGCLRDLISGTKADNQIRCNQIWALTMSYVMVSEDQAGKILQTVYRHLYTPWGLRSLSPDDEEYHGSYGGTQFERDMAYHQGTVWAYPLGAYYLACLRWAKDPKTAVEKVRRQLLPLEACLREGCIGHIAEIYDGDIPDTSRGCFAQAWSVGELLRVYEKIEEMEENKG